MKSRRLPERLPTHALARAARSAALASGLVFWVTSCGSGDAASGTRAPAWAFEREFSGGPVHLVIRLDRTEASLAEQILMEQELRIEPGFEAEFPEYLPEDFEGLSVVGITSPRRAEGTPAKVPSEAAETSPAEPTRASGRAELERREKRLTLEPDRSGELFIAPLAVYFRREGEEKETSFMTEEIPLIIARPEDAASLELRSLREIYAAPPQEGGAGPLPWLLGGGLALACALLGAYLLRRRGVLAPPPPPDEIAYEALRRLIALELVEKGEIELFFVHLSGILRTYVENRFQVHAPERTTEEFLREAARHAALDRHKKRLGRFLAVCDQVKFARFQPDEEAIQEAFDTVRQFLAETKPDAA